MQVERRVSGRFLEWLFATARGAPVSHRLRGAGLDLDRLDADYPAEFVPGWLQILSSNLYPAERSAEAMRRVGFEAAQRRAKAGMSLQQLMTQLPEKFEVLGNFFDVSVRAHGEHRYVAHFDDVNSMPTFVLGLLQGVTSATCTEPLQVVWSPEGLSGARYAVSPQRR
jgi:uncharacterized protein (TIGR02265 family)